MVEIKGLNFSYPRKPLLFKDLYLALNKGHIYGLLGKNGAGKSTLLKNITGLSGPQKGVCLVNGFDSSQRPVSVLEDIYFIAEELYVPELTPAQFVKSTGGFYPKFSISDFYAYLKALDVDADGRLDRLSYGQQKKAMIAFGLATNTSLLIMDEPTNGLDIPSKTQFRKLIASVLTEDRCIVISTHQVRDLDSLIDTILIVHDREIVINSPIDEITEKVTFGIFNDTSCLPVLYEEDGIKGKNAIVKNTTGTFSKIDLELFFNAVTTGNNLLIQTIKAN